jgi:DNA-damage-inducible protein D
MQDDALVPLGDGARLIRKEWHEGRWFLSVVDVIAILTDAAIPRNYWSDLKRRLAQDEGWIELHARIVQLKMRAPDGKMRETDAADVETLLRIVQSIPSPKAEPVKQFLAQVGSQRLEEIANESVLEGLTEAQRRLLLRPMVADGQKSLSAAAHDAGVLTTRDFALFQDSGYQGLYAGETARMIAARKGVKPGSILDYMGASELAANLFRATQTTDKLQREEITGKEAASQAHYEVGAAVRAAIRQVGGTMPEDLPTPDRSIQQVERDEQRRIEAERQPSLFDLPPGDE